MKKLRFIIINIFIFCMLPVVAHADMAPKPQITIKLENAPECVYYMDLLSPVYESWLLQNPTPNDEMASKYDNHMLQQLFTMADEGWFPVLTEQYSLTWGELTSDNGVHTFSYLPPSKFKIIVVTDSGDISISETIDRKTFRTTLTVDYNTMKYTRQPVWQVYPVQFLSSFIPTIIIEYLVLLAFRLKNKNNIKYFLIANTTTQLALNIVISTMMIKDGWGAFLFGWLLLLAPEALIAIVEGFAYSKKFTDCEADWRYKYGIRANIVSALSTLIFLQPMLDNMARIAGF
ncbi:MAG: hypothetical protein IKU54_07055 [Oscillospiraceae bacterium]|nr:hypothetical protein [Oscillospiraceae bacterium]